MYPLCVIYNMAAKYRAPIFRLMDREMEIDWYYGYQIGDIKEMNPTELKRVTRLKRINLGPLFWQCGVVKLLNDNRYQQYLMLGELFSLSTWIMLLKKRLFHPKKKIYLWSHGWYGREGRVKRWLKRRFFGLADGTFLYGNYARQVAIKQGNDPNKLWVIHNSLDYETHLKLRDQLKPSDLYRNHFGNDNPTLIFIGRLTKVKQLNLVIKALDRLGKRGKQFNLVLVGDGEERVNLEQLAAESDANIWFYGGCYDDCQTAQLIYDADLCVSPGNVGLTAIHTMAFGTPVITHSNFSNQMPEFEAIKDGKTGTFFKEGDIDDLANTIELWFKTHTDRNLIRQECYTEIDSSWTPQYQINIINNQL